MSAFDPRHAAARKKEKHGKSGIASTGGITSIWLYLAACLASGVGTAFIFLLPCFVYPLSRQKIEKRACCKMQDPVIPNQ